MKKRTTLLITGGLSVLSIALALTFIHHRQGFTSLNANEPEYEILFNNAKRISNETSSYTNEIDTNATTFYNNSIALKASNIVKNNDGWQTINGHGYFYNPVSELGNNNKISGIKSITYTSDASNTLSLYYGWSINNTEIIYSLKETLTSGVEYIFDGSRPSYFYIQNDSDNPVNVNTLSIKYSCSADPYPYQNLNVLMIGNSFADDTLFYAARIAQSYGININLFDSYIASCTIDKHYTNLSNNSATYSMRTMDNDQWVYSDNMTLTQILQHKTWDVVTFQQASAEVGRESSYSNLTNLVNSVKSVLGYTPRMMWHQTWAYDNSYHEYYDYFSYFNNDNEAMYDAIVSCYQSEVAPLGIFERIIPAGTAVQNLRTSYMKETFCRDGKHMSSVHGRYLLGLDFLSSVYGVDLYKSPCTYLPFDINQSYLNVATECVHNAIEHPLEVTNSVYTTSEISSYDLSNYTEIDAELIGCSYWDARNDTNYNIRLQNNQNISNKYVSTKRFTPTTLPVGSIISIHEAFGVELQTWVNDAQQSAQMNDSYDNIIEVNNNFWNGYSYRAFNIFKCGKIALSGQYVDEQYDQIFDGFHIYVPNESLGDLKAKGYNAYYDTDKTKFQSNSLDIDEYRRVHLDPITGFYKCDSYYYLMNSYVDNTAQRFVCTRPFYNNNEDLPLGTVIILDSGYQYRSDCWGSEGTHSRPNNVSTSWTTVNSNFWKGLRNRTFNVSKTDNSTLVGQNALLFMNSMRIYVPLNPPAPEEEVDTATMTALGYGTLNSAATSMYGKESIPILITLHGDNVNKVTVKVDGSDIGATKYTYSALNGNLTIDTPDSNYGTISGVLNKDQGTITNISITGTIGDYLTDNGSITARELFFDRCNYATNAASQQVWQRWYMSGSWQANSGSGDWTGADGERTLDNDYSMSLRIANNSYTKTRFTLKKDFNNGAGINAHGVSVWLYNPNGNIYGAFRIYIYKAASSTSGDHAVPSGTYTEAYAATSLAANQWVNIQTGFGGETTIYNISLYFESSSSANTYVNLGHVSIY